MISGNSFQNIRSSQIDVFHETHLAGELVKFYLRFSPGRIFILDLMKKRVYFELQFLKEQ